MAAVSSLPHEYLRVLVAARGLNGDLVDPTGLTVQMSFLAGSAHPVGD